MCCVLINMVYPRNGLFLVLIFLVILITPTLHMGMEGIGSFGWGPCHLVKAVVFPVAMYGCES